MPGAASSARRAHVPIPPGDLCKQSLFDHPPLRSLPGRPGPDQLQQDWGAGGPQNHRAPLQGHQGGDAGQPRQLRSLLPQGQHQRKGAGSALPPLLAPHCAARTPLRHASGTPPLIPRARVHTQARDSGASQPACTAMVQAHPEPCGQSDASSDPSQPCTGRECAGRYHHHLPRERRRQAEESSSASRAPPSRGASFKPPTFIISIRFSIMFTCK